MLAARGRCTLANLAAQLVRLRTLLEVLVACQVWRLCTGYAETMVYSGQVLRKAPKAGPVRPHELRSGLGQPGQAD